MSHTQETAAETTAPMDAKAEAKAEKEAAKAKAAVEKEAKAKASAEKKQAAADAKAKKEADAKAKANAIAAKKAAKEANRQPEQNGVRRPGPEGKCGQVWALADHLSKHEGKPVAIATLLEHAIKAGHNVANVRTEYARWKKFHGVPSVPRKVAATPAQPAA